MTWVKNYLLRFRLNENSKCTLDSVGGQTDHHHLPLFATESPSSDSKLARNDVRVALGKAISLKQLKKQTLIKLQKHTDATDRSRFISVLLIILESYSDFNRSF